MLGTETWTTGPEVTEMRPTEANGRGRLAWIPETEPALQHAGVPATLPLILTFTEDDAVDAVDAPVLIHAAARPTVFRTADGPFAYVLPRGCQRIAADPPIHGLICRAVDPLVTSEVWSCALYGVGVDLHAGDVFWYDPALWEGLCRGTPVTHKS